MALAVSALNGVKVYNLSAGKTLPEWLESTKTAQTRTLRYNDDFRRRLELIQDFDFPTASTHVNVSPDGRYIIAAGVYRPQIKVFEVDQLSLKFERHLDAEIVAMNVLSDDYSKMAILRADRTVELHARYGFLHSIRVPKYGRDMAYNPTNCDLLVCGSSSEMWRLNLEQGQFLGGFETGLTEINVVEVNPLHQLVGLGGLDASIEMWDPRDRTRASSLLLGSAYDGTTVGHRLSDALGACDVTALQFAADGLTMAVGTSTGHVLLYDLRSARPLLVKDHRYGQAISDIKFHEGARKLLSTDGKIIKVWDRLNGDAFTSMQTDAPVHRLCLIPNSGLIFGAGEQHRIPSFYIPELGPAPKWCSFLDSLTEELEEETRASSFDDFKFVTRADLTGMGLTHLIGTNLLKAYMHGYFMDMRLWHKVRAIAEPFEYDNYVKKRVKAKIEEQRAERITVARKVPKVNKDYAEALLQSKASGHSAPAFDNPLCDDRFASLFKDADFSIDKESDEFTRLHPTNAKLGGVSDVVADGRFAMVDESDDSEEEVGVPSDAGSGSDSDVDDLFTNAKLRRERPPKKVKKSKKKLAMFEVKQLGELPLSAADVEPVRASGGRDMKKSLADRVRQLNEAKAARAAKATEVGVVQHHGGGSRSITFYPKHSGKADSDNEERGGGKKRNRRPVKF